MDTHRKSTLYAVAQFVLLAVFAAVFFLQPGRFLLSPMKIAGVVVAFTGLALMAVAFVHLRDVIQVAPEPRADGHLVTSGVYAHLRHPIYTGIVFLVIGLFLGQPAVNVAIAGVVLLVFLIVKSRFEERLLGERYPEYAEYRKRTWGVVPGL